MRKRNYRRRFRDERNLKRDKLRGIDFWAAGITDPDVSVRGIKERLIIQRLKHITKGLHWYSDEYRNGYKYEHGFWGFRYYGDLPF